MKNSKKIITSFLTILTVASLATSALGAENSGVSGGWSESGGYYINSPAGISTEANAFTTAASGTPSPTPDKHTGSRLTSIDSSGIASYAAFGETVWYYKYHYTNAQMELKDGTVKTTSGRQWDWNATKATSPYYTPGLFENTEARTYWGS